MPGADADPARRDRYARQPSVADAGTAGRSDPRDGSVLCVGAGGLGSPAIEYLAAAGVGALGIVDDDVVERSNLQRQVVHADADVGRTKVESAREYVETRNPDVDVRTHDVRLARENVAELVDGYDLVVDGSDNFPTRYLVNDACTLAGVPFTHGAVYRFEGQVTTFSGGSPCYRCLFPEAPPPGTVPNCATAGVLGVVPGVVGTLQAAEAVKYLLGRGALLDGRLVSVDAARLRFETVAFARDPDCPVCGDDPAVTSVRDVTYEGACAVPTPE